jgi:hypothetical protein
MTNDDIIRMAQKAGMVVVNDQFSLFRVLVRFATLVAAHEREQCEKVCDEMGDYAEKNHVNYPHWTPWGAARECALKIRLNEKT